MSRSIVTISSKRQFTIPNAIRAQLGLKPGGLVTLTIEDSAIIPTPIGDDPANNGRGPIASQKGPFSRQSFQAIY
jgi:AbrB family looped-hinge helix DNA binding protein